MSRRCCVFAATSLLIACPAPANKPHPPPKFADTALRIRVAQAEASRANGVADLVELATHGTTHERVLALRGLGRIGGPRALATLLGALHDTDRGVSGAAAGAIGVAASLDDSDLGATDALLAALPDANASAPLVIEALGRAGVAAAQPALVAALADPKLAEAAALALGRHGRRKIALSEPARAALVTATRSADPAVRYAAVYALMREHQPPETPEATAALVARLADPDPETRAQAIAGLGKRKAIAAARASGARLDELLLDRDWRVAVEAIRALGETDDGRDAIAATIMRRYGELESGDPAAAHIVIEGEKALATGGNRPIVATALATLATSTATTLPALTRGWIGCLAIAASVRAMPNPDLAALEHCGQGALPDHLRLPLLAELITANVGSLAARRAALAGLLAHKDPRVRAAGIGALAALWKAGDASDHENAVATLVAALASADPIVAGSAVDAAPAVYDAIKAGDQARAAGLASLIDAAVVARARTEREPELASSILELIGKRAIAAGADACRTGLTGHPVRAKAAASCLKELGEAAQSAPAPIEPPPVDVTQVIGKTIRWHLTTSRGEVVIGLRPDVAPWAVATIVTLTRKGFYDGLEFHRVVPNFVVQGGDPTQSGWGGPGFTTPAEPASAIDGLGYVVGGVGIADAGRDSGGSQWFIMHSRAPHLDGRYTWIGGVEAGQKSADALLIGDRVVRAAVEIAPN